MLVELGGLVGWTCCVPMFHLPAGLAEHQKDGGQVGQIRTDESDINDQISPSHTETDQDNYGVCIHSTMWILIEGRDNVLPKHLTL